MIRRKRGLSAPGFAGGLVLASAALLLVVIIFYPKISAAAEIFFSILGLDDSQKNQKLTGKELETISGSPEFTISIFTRAYEKCASLKQNDCLCNTGESLDIEEESPITLSKSGPNDIEVRYKGKSLIIPEITGCRLETVIREPDYMFSSRNIPLGTIELKKDSNTGDIVTSSANGIKYSFRLNPIQLFRHNENGQTYLCLVPRNINYNACSG